MATTHDATPYFTGTTPEYSAGMGRFGIMRFHVDMAVVAAALAATVDGSASDVLQIWDIPAMTHILCVAANLIKAEGAACTMTIGDGTQPAGFLASFNLNTTLLTKAMTLNSDAYGLTFGKTYPSTDTLDVVFGTAADVDLCVFDVAVACIFFDFPDLSISAPATWK